MNKNVWVLTGMLLLVAAGRLLAETTVTVDDISKTVTVSQEQTQATPVLIARVDDSREFEGEIINIDYGESRIVVRDTTGSERKVIVKQGMINNYKVDDYVQVKLMADMKEAKMIHVVRDAERFEGTVVRVEPGTSQIIVKDEQGRDRTLVVASGMTSYFASGNHVRIYLVPDHKEAQLIRIGG